MVKKISNVKVIIWLALPLIMGIILLSPKGAVQAEFLPPGVVPEQCANGEFNEVPDCRATGSMGWKNSQANPNNSHYGEGDFIPYRQVLDGLDVGAQYCFGFSWDVSQGGLPAIDYMGNFDQTLTTADPLYQTIHDGNLATPDDTIAFPTDPTITSGYVGAVTNVFTGTLPATREIALWGATFDSIGPYSGVGGDISLAANEENSIEYCLTTTDVEVVLAFSGHIAVPEEWGQTVRPGGSPYHLANGTKNGLATAPRTGETDLACVAPDGTITNSNIGRRETQLQVSDTPLAINLQGITVGSNASSTHLVLVAVLVIFLLSAYAVTRTRSKPQTIA